ncbi:MAG: LLM class F420-dependent oxidoreductase [Actinobacteria bacterium HGW-Actinobacteria-4]|nr:MAG: LLM class F420-dependent oxidoreductase [Actinobacteria bacterium HGW-Actinobacteria-4]
MPLIGFHASHEQIAPRQLLTDVKHAEQAGFTAAMCSDHFAPWSRRQGESGFAWSWLGAALEATTIPLGVVNAPGQRYHPAIIAQAMGTLAQMYPGRFWAALGSGENINEHITGDPWPSKEHRNERLLESVGVIQRLLAGETVSVDGHVIVDRATLFTKPSTKPAVYAAAVSEETAAWSAQWAEGMITVGIDVDDVKRTVDAYRQAGGKGPTYFQLHVSYARSDSEALAIAHDQWRTHVYEPPMMWDVDSVDAFDAAGENVTPDQLHSAVRVSADLAQHAAWIAEYADLGFDGIMVHHVGQHQAEFIDAFGEHVLPQVAGGRR